MRAGRAWQWLSMLMMVALAGCRATGGPVTSPHGDAGAALRRLDDAHAAEFRQAFDDHKDRTRYVAALSPT